MDADAGRRNAVRPLTGAVAASIRIGASAVNMLGRAPLLVSSVSRMLRDDPAHFGVQIVRRLPSRARDLVGRLPVPGSPDSSLRILRLLALDRTDECRALLEASPRSTPLLDAVRVQVGARLGDHAAPSARARALWARGDVDQAIRTSPSPLRERFDAQLRVLTPGKVLELPSFASRPRPRPRAWAKTRNGATGAGMSRDGGSGIRVLHALTNSLPWTYSGYSLRSHAVLRAQAGAGLEVRAVTRLAYPVTIGRPWAPESDLIDGITYRRLLPERLPALEDERLALHALLLAEEARDFDARILHTTTDFRNALVTRAAARALGIPWVYEFRGELEKSWVARRPRDEEASALASRRYRLMRARETELATKADAVVALSRHQADSLVRRGIPAAKILIAPNGVDASLIEEPRAPERAKLRLGLEPSRPWIGTVSALVDYEGLDTLIDALPRLREQGFKPGCVIIGDGVCRESLIQRARAWGLEVARGREELRADTELLIPGRVPPEAALDWYRALDVMTVPRRDTPVTRAVTPIKGLQAMALGVPLIVSDLPALVEVGALDGQGLAVPAGEPQALADAIARIVQDPSIASRLAAAGRSAAAARTWDAIGRGYAELYASLMD